MKSTVQVCMFYGGTSLKARLSNLIWNFALFAFLALFPPIDHKGFLFLQRIFTHLNRFHYLDFSKENSFQKNQLNETCQSQMYSCQWQNRILWQIITPMLNLLNTFCLKKRGKLFWNCEMSLGFCFFNEICSSLENCELLCVSVCVLFLGGGNKLWFDWWKQSIKIPFK